MYYFFPDFFIPLPPEKKSKSFYSIFTLGVKLSYEIGTKWLGDERFGTKQLGDETTTGKKHFLTYIWLTLKCILKACLISYPSVLSQMLSLLHPLMLFFHLSFFVYELCPPGNIEIHFKIKILNANI